MAAEFQGCDVGVQGALGCGGDFAWFDCGDGFWEVLSTAAHAGVLQWQLSLLVGVVLLLHCKGGRVKWIVPSWIRWPSSSELGISELGVARGLFGLAYFLHGADELAALFSLGTVFGGIGCVELRHALASAEVWTLLCDSVKSVSLVVTLTLLMHVGRPLALHRCMHP